MITALVPIKKESERLSGKNFLDFCGQPLFQVILDKLERIDEISKIVVNTDSEEIHKVVSQRYKKVVTLERPLFLAGNKITMNKIIEYDLSQVDGEHFLQTHCTNPLLKVETIQQAISIYFKDLVKYDSLLSIDAIQKRAYHQNGEPINHHNDKLEQTQHLPKVYIENSNLFLFSRSSFLNANKSRIGLNPQFFSMSSHESLDIDYKEDFLLAELIARNQKLLNVELPDKKTGV